LFDVPEFIVHGVPKQSAQSQYTPELAGHVLVSSAALKYIQLPEQFNTANDISTFAGTVIKPYTLQVSLLGQSGPGTTSQVAPLDPQPG